MVIIHGGGFLSTSSKTSGWAPTVSRYFAMYGYYTVSIEYRRYSEVCREGTNGLCPEMMFSAPVHDAMAAVRYLVANSVRLGIDPSKIGVFGCSAGGITATHLLLADYGEGDSGNAGYASRVHAGISLSGGFHESQWSKRKTQPGSVAPYMAIHSEDDPLVQHSMSEDAVALAEELGADSVLRSLPGEGHCPNVIVPGAPGYEFDKVAGFLVNSLALCNEFIVFP